MIRGICFSLSVALLVSAAFAQQEAPPPPLRIYHFSAKPVLHENGQAWDLQVRFVTSEPALTTVDYGGTRECPNSAEPTVYWDVRPDEPLRNHRFDIAAPLIDASLFVRARVRTADGREARTETIEVRPPGPFPAGDLPRQVIPLTVVETEGVARDEPVTFGIPLPYGAIGRVNMCALSDGSVPVPIAARALVRWPDRTIKWLLVSGRVRLAANQTKTLELVVGTELSVEQPPPLAQDGDGRIAVDLGVGRFAIGKLDGKGALFHRNTRVCTTPLSVLTTADGHVFRGRVESVTLEENNHQRAVILVSGQHVNDAGEAYFGFELRYFCHAGDPFVRVDHILKHDIVSADMKYGDEMKSFAALDLVWDMEAASTARVATTAGLLPLVDGARLFQHADDAFELGDAADGRAPGLVQRGPFSVAVRNFWQNWPKSLASHAGKLTVGLYPAITPPDRYQDKPDEWLLYYYIRDGLYTFRSGFQKRHELLMGPADAATPEQVLARVNAPLLASAAPEWYCSSGAFPGIRSDKTGEFDFWDEAMDRGIDQYFEIQEAGRWYGLMNFGDSPGGRSRSWANIEYDRQHGLLRQYFRTGDHRFFEAAEQMARHSADVDVVHHAAGQRAGPGRARRVGQAWVHCMGHTGGYYPHNYQGASLYSSGYCENEGHMWAQGNWQYWLLTGDAQVHRAARQLTDWGSGPNTASFRYGNARVPGWMGIIAMSGYFATGDEYYLNGMRLMYEVVQELGDEKYGLWIHRLGGGHCGCEEKHFGEAGFMAGVLMTALKYFHLATGDAEVAERIVKIAHFIVDTMWVPESGEFRYTSCPNTGTGALLMTLMANGMAFAANYSDDERLRDIVREGVARALVAVNARGPGRQINYGLPIASTPLAMYEIGRFPGPSLARDLRVLKDAAFSPVLRPVPSLVPNPDFEETGNGWRTRPNLAYQVQSDVVHTGRAAAMASGDIAKQGEYLVTWYDCGPPWEIQSLAPGERYRAQLWLRVDRLGEGAPSPRPRVAFRSGSVTRGSASLTEYDMGRAKQWQLLEGEFTVPEGTDAIYIAVSTMTAEPQQDVLMYLDDIAIVPAASPRRDVLHYPAANAQQATLSGGLALAPDPYHRGWQAISSPEGRGGTATVELPVPAGDEFRLFLRAKAPEQSSRVGISVNGRRIGELRIEQSPAYEWLALPGAVRLEQGPHTITITWPADCGAVVQKVCLTNEPEP